VSFAVQESARRQNYSTGLHPAPIGEDNALDPVFITFSYQKLFCNFSLQ
jgi:hypothetical protein